MKPHLNVRQRKDPAIPPHSRLFSLQFRPVILYSERMLYLPLGLEDKYETDKIHPSRIISQKLERAAFNAGRHGGYGCFYAGWL
ncbi:hypothetical protein IVY21_00055 [Salmonella enterica subsp. enterica serovar Worthington]|nr:hypothetical protein [Salmonella enterica subsp. enterica serovar Worthington]